LELLAISSTWMFVLQMTRFFIFHKTLWNTSKML
jgi:hypothetical protein